MDGYPWSEVNKLSPDVAQLLADMGYPVDEPESEGRRSPEPDGRTDNAT